MDATTLRLRDFPAGLRLGLTLLLLVNLGGFLASAAHTRTHHEGRDERPGLSLDDLRGAYHGLQSRAPLLGAIESGHPGELEGSEPLPESKRRILLEWLEGSSLSEDYDNLDLGDAAPAEILDAACVSCHRRQSPGEAAQTGQSALPLEYWDDVKRVAFSRDIQPTPTAILATSTHTHAIALATISLILVLLLQLSSSARWLKSLLGALIGIGLAGDLASWWLARESALFVWAIVGFGALFALAVGLISLLLIVDMWRPERPKPHA
jgi:hypothetical protein